MPDSPSFSDSPPLLDRLPEQAATLIRQVAGSAEAQGAKAYLVGGIVRDLVLKRPSLDLDIAVEGDAIAIAGALAAKNHGRLVVHRDFGTASLSVHHLVLDFAATRTESYPRPGALPVVKAGGLLEDLRRRDYTINAMAIAISSEGRGRLIDPLGGLADLRAGLVRVIREGSFRDDATRMLRGVRYEQRFGFVLEPHTLALLHRDEQMLDTISGERVRYELERGFSEPRPDAVMARTAELGLLQTIHPALAWDEAKVRGFRALPDLGELRMPAGAALLTLGLAPEAVRAVAERLRFPKDWLTASLDSRRLSAFAPRLEQAGLRNSEVVAMLSGLAPAAIDAAAAVTSSQNARALLRLYRDVLADTQTLLSGRDILALGVAPGPAVGEARAALRGARLDGEVHTREEEMAFVQAWLAMR